MQSEEQRLIEGLFGRLKNVETQTSQRDYQAEEQIKEHIRQQPNAPYYMAQAILIQEAALKQMDQRIKELESQVLQLQQAAANANKPSSGGFLSGLFGGGSKNAAQDAWGNNSQSTAARSQASNTTTTNSATNCYGQPLQSGAPQASYNQTAPQNYAQQPQNYQQPQQNSGGSSFLGGALKTAAGVAGGVLLAETISGMFRDSRPEEIVNVINEQVPEALNAQELPDIDPNNLDAFNYGDDQNRFMNTGFDNSNYDNNDYGNDDYDDSDDDSFI